LEKAGMKIYSGRGIHRPVLQAWSTGWGWSDNHFRLEQNIAQFIARVFYFSFFLLAGKCQEACFWLQIAILFCTWNNISNLTSSLLKSKDSFLTKKFQIYLRKVHDFN